MMGGRDNEEENIVANGMEGWETQSNRSNRVGRAGIRRVQKPTRRNHRVN